MDVKTPKQRSINMRAIKGRGTKIEITCSRALRKRGLFFTKNNKNVFGCPDICFTKKRIAVFIDSEFFHGRNWQVSKFRIKSNRSFWWTKIEKNIIRDKKVTITLQRQGWKVFRFWDTDILRNIDAMAIKIQKHVEMRNT